MPEFYRYLVYQLDKKRDKYPFPHAQIYARDDVEAWDLWEEYAVDGPHDVCIEYKKDKQVPFVKVMWRKSFDTNGLGRPRPGRAT